jgi:hypothetical protein
VQKGKQKRIREASTPATLRKGDVYLKYNRKDRRTAVRVCAC